MNLEKLTPDEAAYLDHLACESMVLEEKEFVLEWAREWTKGYMFIGSARKALKELGIPEVEMEKMIYRLVSPQEQCAEVEEPVRDVKCPWASKAEFEERKKLWA